MNLNMIAGYAWIALGLFCLVFFGGKLLLQLLGLIAGISLIFRGLQILAFDRAVYRYSRHYFENNFKK